jgi:hypothetical protein
VLGRRLPKHRCSESKSTRSTRIRNAGATACTGKRQLAKLKKIFTRGWELHVMDDDDFRRPEAMDTNGSHELQT